MAQHGESFAGIERIPRSFSAMLARLGSTAAFPSVSSPNHNIHRRGSGTCGIFSASRNAGFVLAVSDRALIIRAAADETSDHDGTNPQRISDNSRTGSFGFSRITGTGWVGAML